MIKIWIYKVPLSEYLPGLIRIARRVLSLVFYKKKSAIAVNICTLFVNFLLFPNARDTFFRYVGNVPLTEIKKYSIVDDYLQFVIPPDYSGGI